MHQYDVLGKRRAVDDTDRVNHFLTHFECVVVSGLGQNEGNLCAVRASYNANPSAVYFLDNSYHFFGGSVAARDCVQGTSVLNPTDAQLLLHFVFRIRFIFTAGRHEKRDSESK